jgi:transposase-like protein
MSGSASRLIQASADCSEGAMNGSQRRGPGAVSMAAVAQRAGVSKATIYRWRPTNWRPAKESPAPDARYHEAAGRRR